MHAVRRITVMLYQIFTYRRLILRNLVLKSLQAYIFLNLYTKIKVKKDCLWKKEHTNRKLGLIESLHMQNCSLRGCIPPIPHPHPL